MNTQENDIRSEREKIFTIIYSSLIICAIAISSFAILKFFDYDTSRLSTIKNHTDYTLLRIFLSVLSLFAVFISIPLLWRWLFRRIFRQWWDPAPYPNGSLEWTHVLALTCTHPSFDPIHHKPSVRWGYLLRRTPVIILTGVLGVFLSIIAIDFILNPRIPALLKSDPSYSTSNLGSLVLNVSGNLTAYLALLASVVTIAFTYHQLRSKVRADNRRAWLGNLRASLSTVIAVLIKIEYLEKDVAEGIATELDLKNLRRSLDKPRMKLEMLLNQAEKDHRILLHLIHQCIFRTPEEVSDYANIHSILVGIVCHNPHLDEMRDKLVKSTNLSERISHILRLSHVVLKREWERVKHTR